MPRIFDNIEQSLLPALGEALGISDRADFCVGYFNLRGWKSLDTHIERWAGGRGHCCRLLVGMQRLPQEDLRALLGLSPDRGTDQATVVRLKRQLVQDFREQLAVGVPTAADEAGLQRLAAQVRDGKVVVKLFLRHPLHAKLYLLFRPDPVSPSVAFLGSSNLTLAGLSLQGELNIDVLDQDACRKLAGWFEERWNDRWCLDISEDLVRVIEESWARVEPVPPYLVYVKMAYHLAREAREGISGYQLPPELQGKLCAFQEAAVKIGAHHVNTRGGVLIGDVVGLGKTLMATALARLFEEEGMETLILCPSNLVEMWTHYRERYSLRGKVMSLGVVTKRLPEEKRYRLLVIDESHNLRNREGRRYAAIRDYVQKNDSKCILLSATPYNKAYTDLSSQLRLFLPDDHGLPIRPEGLFRTMGETEFIRRHQCSPRSLAAFEHSEDPDDWRELMRLFLVRRTRSFIMANYAETDPTTGRRFLAMTQGRPYYFPTRVPKTVTFAIDERDPHDQYARLYDVAVVDIVNRLHLPRYGLGNYAAPTASPPRTAAEEKEIGNLSRAGKRLMGFCRTNLFKRLESSGQAFLQSVARHVLRNHIYLHAIENGLDLPIGTQDAGLLDAGPADEDTDAFGLFLGTAEETDASGRLESCPRTEAEFRRLAVAVYRRYADHGPKRFRWLRPGLFDQRLPDELRADAAALVNLLGRCGDWDPAADAKLKALVALLRDRHPQDKVLVFSQFADTVRYLEAQLGAHGIERLAGATGDSNDPTALAWRFSPRSNEKADRISPASELRVLVATDVLSEGQNLQDCAVVVNYDLPWAIIRLVQRVGRVDRIGQEAEAIRCYSFLPAAGVERLLRLRARVRQRLHENAEVVGTDEAFFEDDRDDHVVRDLFTEKAGILDGDADNEVDLASYAYQIWKNAVAADPLIEKRVTGLPPVVYATKSAVRTPSADGAGADPAAMLPEGVLVYLRTGDDNDALAWVGRNGETLTESQKAILDAARCTPGTPPRPRLAEHHDLARRGVEQILREERTIGGQLGRPSGARFRCYERLTRYAAEVKDTLFDRQDLHRAIEDIYRFPLRDAAKDILNRLLKAHASDESLAEKAISLRDADALSVRREDSDTREPRIICSLGLRQEA
jgi:superfamily II DNA or RNA helicase